MNNLNRMQTLPFIRVKQEVTSGAHNSCGNTLLVE